MPTRPDIVCNSHVDHGLSTLRFVRVSAPFGRADGSVTHEMWREYIGAYVRGSAALGGQETTTIPSVIDQLSAGYPAGDVVRVPGVDEEVVLAASSRSLVSEALSEGAEVFVGVGDSGQVPESYVGLSPVIEGGELRTRDASPVGRPVTGVHSVIAVTDDAIDTDGCPEPGELSLLEFDEGRRTQMVDSLVGALESGSGDAVRTVWQEISAGGPAS